MPYIVDCQFWLLYPSLFLFVGFLTMELPGIVRESSIEGRNKQVEAKMLDMGWQHSHHGRAWNSYRKGEFYLDSFWPEPELVVEEARRVDEGVKAGARVLAQYMDILGK